MNLVQCHTDKYKVFVVDNDEFVGHEIRTSGKLWEDWIGEDIKQYYEPGTDILDIGANIGTHSLMFSETGNVHAFEPVFHEIVKLNIESNDLKHNVKIYPFALSDKEETLNIYIPETTAWGARNYGGTSMHPNELTKHDIENPLKCMCYPLDNVYDGKPSIIKMDVENHELYVLKGAINTITKHKPVIYAEIADPDTSEVVKFIENLGYNKPIAKTHGVYVFIHASINRLRTQS